MTIDINQKKDVFMSGDKKTILYMLDYLKNSLGISEADYWNYIGYYVISVPHEQYELALLNGKNFACQKDMGLYWLNYYNERRSPVASIDVGYGLLPKIVPGEQEKKYVNRNLWDYYDENTPKVILEYLNAMKDYLKVDRIKRDYHSRDDALRISPITTDYETKSQLFKEFVENNGTGPFKEIHPLTFTGEYVSSPILVKKIK